MCEVPATAVPVLDPDTYPPLYVGAEQRVQLWQGEGTAPAGCSSLELPVMAGALRWLGLVAQDPAAAAPPQVVLQGSFDAAVRVSEFEAGVVAEAPQPPAPSPLGRDLLSQQLPAARQRSAWFWAPLLWQQQAPRLLELAEARQLQRLYLSVPVQDSTVQQAQGLQDFVAAAHARGLQVWPVLGDPRHVLAGERAALQAQVAAYLQYNATVAAEARLDGLQLDIEPHLLPGFALAQPQWRQRWLDTVNAVQRQLAGALPLDLVIPVWWGSHPAWGETLLAGLQGPALSLTIMNYRTADAALRAGAQPFLAWGPTQDVPVSIALEAGSIGPDEQRLQFVQADAGELLWLQLGDYRLLALLDQEQAAAPGQSAYRLQRQQRAAAAAITFAGDLQRLETVAAALEPEWRSSPAYAGLAIHGLDEVLLQPARAMPQEAE